MREAQGGFLTAVDDLYAASTGQVAWTVALKSVANGFGGAGAVVFDLDLDTQQFGAWVHHGLDGGSQEYIDHFNAINPRMKYSAPRAAGHIVHEARFITEAEMDRHEFYDWVGRSGGLRYFIGSKIQQRGSLATFTSIEFTRRHGNATPFQVDRFGLLIRHIRNAWNISSRIDQFARGREMFVNDRLPWGIFALDLRGRVIDANAAGRAMVACGDGLAISEGHLQAAKAADNRSLQAMIADLLGSEPPTLPDMEVIAISRPGGLPQYSVQLVPYVRPSRSGEEPAVIVYVTDPMARSAVSEDHLRKLFGLSPREAALATSIGQGLSLGRAASAMAISINTARNHLRSIFRKTGTHSQTELVRLLVRLLPDAGCGPADPDTPAG